MKFGNDLCPKCNQVHASGIDCEREFNMLDKLNQVTIDRDLLDEMIEVIRALAEMDGRNNIQAVKEMAWVVVERLETP